MPISFNCPSCDKLFSVPDEMAGRNATCNNCGTMFTVPQLDDGDDDSAPQTMAPIYAPPTSSYRTHRTQIPWGTIILLLGAIVLAYYGYLWTRDTWEVDNKEKLVSIKAEADKQFKKDAVDKAKISYQEFIDLVGSRKLKDEKIASMYKDSQSKLTSLRERANEKLIQQQREIEEKQMEHEKELARQERARLMEIEKAKEQERLRFEAIQKQAEDEVRRQEEEQKKLAEQERLAAAKRATDLEQGKEKLSPTPLAAVTSTPLAPIKPEDNVKGDECPLCNGLKKGNFTYNDPYIWYDQVQPNVVVRIITRLLFTPSENGSEICPACGGKGKGVGIAPTTVLMKDLPEKTNCKNCDGFGKLVKYRLDNKWYGYPYGKTKCTKCLGTGKSPGGISAGSH